MRDQHATQFLAALERLRASEAEQKAARDALYDAETRLRDAEASLKYGQQAVATHFQGLQDLTAETFTASD